MARFLAYYLCLILVNAHLVLAKQATAEATVARKLGKHTLESKIAASSPSPAEASALGEEIETVAQEQVMKIDHRRNRSVDKSVAGGGLILGGLATTFLVAVFCYIRATARKTAEPASPTNSSSSTGRKNGGPGSPINSSN